MKFAGSLTFQVFICLILMFCVSGISNLIKLTNCPAEQSTIQWDQRSMALCGDEKLYHCLEDESSSSDSFYEFCATAVEIDKGYYPTYNPVVEQIIQTRCPTDHFQELKLFSYRINKCTEKQLCDDSGQMTCEDGPATENRVCMCDYMQGYASNDHYGTNPNKTEICCRTGVPCKCFKVEPPCENQAGHELNAASQCVKKCEDGYYRPLKSLECVVKITAASNNETTTLANISTTQNSTAGKQADSGESKDNTDLYIIVGVISGVLVVFVIIAIIIIIIVKRRRCRSIGQDGKVTKNGLNGQQPSNQVTYNINADTVLIGDNNVAAHVRNDDDESNNSRDTSGSEFTGFPRKQSYQKLEENETLARGSADEYGGATDTFEKYKKKKETFKESYQKCFKSLSEAAAEKGLSVQDVPGDGNCMYNSTLIQLESQYPKLTVDEMRKHVQKFIESNPSTPGDVTYKSLLSALDWKPGPKSRQHEDYKKLQRYKSVEESQKEELLFQIYLNEVRENEWGDPFTLHALSQIYNVEIKVLSSRNLSEFTKTSVVDNPKMTIFLGHLAVNGEDLHYVALLPSLDSVDSEHVDVKFMDNSDVKNTINVNPAKSCDAETEDISKDETEVKEPLLTQVK